MSTEKHYTPDELSRLHEVLYDVLGEVVRICERHDIPYFLIGGTAIGALYDEAILPWDDDVDIGMKRDDYERFLRIAPSELGREYFLSWQETDPHSPYYFAKVKKNGTLFVEELFPNVPMHQGIFVDIFPFDRIPDSPRMERLHRSVVSFLNCCLMGKECWMWRHYGTCEIANPTDRSRAACFLNRVIDTLLGKRAVYRLMRWAQTWFNGCRTRYYNNTMTRTDHITEAALNDLVKWKFGPLQVLAPRDLEGFLRYNYPTLHRFTPDEQARVANHYPVRLSFDTAADNLTKNA